MNKDRVILYIMDTYEKDNPKYFVENMIDVEKVCYNLLFSRDLTPEKVQKIRDNKTYRDEMHALFVAISTGPEGAVYNLHIALKLFENAGLADRWDLEQQAMGDGMNKNQKACIQRNEKTFISDMFNEGSVLNRLLFYGILSDISVKEIKSERTRQDLVHKLHEKLTMRSAGAFNAYYTALNTSGNELLAELLEPHLSPELPRREKRKIETCDGDKEMAGQVMTATSVEPKIGVSLSSQQKQHVLVSYHEMNKRVIKDVRDALREHGYMVLMRIDDQTGNVYEWTVTAIKNSFAVLVAFSKTYTEDNQCIKEVEYADRIKKPIILLSMEPDFKASETVNFITKSLIPIPFTRAVVFDKSLNKLLRELEAAKKK